jgi:hypothetical protein
MTRQDAIAFIRSCYPRNDNDTALFCALSLAVETHGWDIVTDEGVFQIALDLNRQKIEAKAALRERLSHMAEIIPLNGDSNGH